MVPASNKRDDKVLTLHPAYRQYNNPIVAVYPRGPYFLFESPKTAAKFVAAHKTLTETHFCTVIHPDAPVPLLIDVDYNGIVNATRLQGHLVAALEYFLDVKRPFGDVSTFEDCNLDVYATVDTKQNKTSMHIHSRKHAFKDVTHLKRFMINFARKWHVKRQ